MNTDQFDQCINCGGNKDTPANGFIVCTDCGFTKRREFVDTKPSLSRDGKFKTKQDSIGKSLDFVGSLGSQIGYDSGFMRNINGKDLTPRLVSKYKRLKNNYHDKIRLEGKATHLRTLISFNRVFNTINLSKDIKQRSLYIYWEHVKSKRKFTNHILLIAVCLLQAIREAGTRAPVRFSEIISAFNQFGHRVTNKNLLRLARDLNIPLSPYRRKAEDYIERLASSVKNDQKVKEKLNEFGLDIHEYQMLLFHIASKFLYMLSSRERGGVQPYPLAVSIIYLSDRVIARTNQTKSVLTQKLLAKIANSAEFTIRDHVYRFLGDYYQKYEKILINFCNKKKGR